MADDQLDEIAQKEKLRLERAFKRLSSREQVVLNINRSRSSSQTQASLKKSSSTSFVGPTFERSTFERSNSQLQEQKEPFVSRRPDFKSGEKQLSATENATSSLKGKLDEVQIADYLNWVSQLLGQQVQSLDQFSDGVLLIALLEKLSGKKMGRYNKTPKLTPQKLDNVNVAVMFMDTQLGINLKSFSPNAFISGNTDCILSIIFSLAKKFRSDKASVGIETTLKQYSTPSSPEQTYIERYSDGEEKKNKEEEERKAEEARKQKEEEQRRRQEEEEQRRRQEEEQRKQEEEERRKQQQERRKQEEEQRRKQEEQEQRRKQQEEEQRRKQQQEEEQSRKQEEERRQQEEQETSQEEQVTKATDEKKVVTITWSYEGTNVSLTGSFVNWTEQIPLSLKNGIFETQLHLSPGKYFFKFIVDGKWLYDVNSPYITDQSGNVNNVIQVE